MILLLITLEFTSLVLAFGMVAIAIALSVWQKIGLEWQLAIAAASETVNVKYQASFTNLSLPSKSWQQKSLSPRKKAFLVSVWLKHTNRLV
jgi:hypothetical protein